MVTESITLAPRLTRRQVAAELGVTAKTVKHWTGKGILTAKTWKSPGGRQYLDYDAGEVDKLRESMRPE